jgi:cytidylate kinase
MSRKIWEREVGKVAVVAIDGPSGAGKSSVSRAIAEIFHWSYLDTGALYRALTLFALESAVGDPSEIPARLRVGTVTWDGNPAAPTISLAGRVINEEIRSQQVTENVSAIAADPQVRRFLLSMQREIINNAARGIVVEGRDIGTTVWPDAELKIFLTADLTARAERRNAELARALSHNDVEKSLAARDVIDSTRASSPLRQTDDQVVIDATHLSIDEVVSEITKLVAQLKIAKAVENDE